LIILVVWVVKEILVGELVIEVKRSGKADKLTVGVMIVTCWFIVSSFLSFCVINGQIFLAELTLINIYLSHI